MSVETAFLFKKWKEFDTLELEADTVFEFECEQYTKAYAKTLVRQTAE